MSEILSLLAALAAKGLDQEGLEMVANALERERNVTLTLREKNRQRQQRFRASRRNVTVTFKGSPKVPPIDNITLTPSLPLQNIRTDFEEFWKVWPNKVGKPAALRAYASASRKPSFDRRSILEGVARYAREKPADRPWLNPSTFLNQERWNDKPAPLTANGCAHELAAVSDKEFVEFDTPAWESRVREGHKRMLKGIYTVNGRRVEGWWFPKKNVSEPIDLLL